MITTTVRRPALPMGLVLLAAAGCTTTSPGQPPFGTWEGTGRFTEVLPVIDAATSQPVDFRRKMTQRDYRTTLSISPAILDGHDVIIIEIFSYSGIFEDEKNKDVHLQLALEEIPSSALQETEESVRYNTMPPRRDFAQRVTLYRQVASALNADPKETLLYDPAAVGPGAPAACTTCNGVTWLQIFYQEHYWDVFRFEGGTVEKSGVFFDDQHSVHWFEKLNRN